MSGDQTIWTAAWLEKITAGIETLQEIQKEKHRKRHQELHEVLDELVADFIANTRALPSKNSIMDLIRWSAIQIKEPDHDP